MRAQMRFGKLMHMQLDANLDLDAIGAEEGKAMVASRFRAWCVGIWVPSHSRPICHLTRRFVPLR